MPLKKKYVPGVAKKYLTDNFSNLPPAVDVTAGHIIYVYLLLGNSSRAETVRQLHSFFNCTPGHSVSLKQSLVNDIRRLVSRTLDKFKHLSNEKEFEKFSTICSEPFSILTEDDVTLCELNAPSDIQAPDIPTSVSLQGMQEPCFPPSFNPDIQFQPSTPDVLPNPTTSSGVRSTRYSSTQMTPRKLKMKKRLEFLSSSNHSLRKKYQDISRTTRVCLKTPKRVVNQAIKRKMAIIRSKNERIEELQKGSVVLEAKRELHRLKEAHTKMMLYRRQKKTVPISVYRRLRDKLTKKDSIIRALEHDKLLLSEKLEEMECRVKDFVVVHKANLKTYSTNTRLKVFDHIVNQVPTLNIPSLMRQNEVREGRDGSDVPHRTTVELMARELGAVAELQTAETILHNKVTLGFDATTQEGTHVNSIHFTTKKNCVAGAVDELPGGTGEDYANHITQTVDSLAETYCYFNDADYQVSRQNLINNITSTMSDRCAANAAALRLVQAAWKKPLHELNCHLHPLDTIASTARATLKRLEESRGKLYGSDCIAANVVLQVNKLRFKDGKGDPKGFVTFLRTKNLPCGLLPRYRGNRLHILFKIGGIFIEHYEVLEEFFLSGTSCGGLRSSILQDFRSDTAKLEFFVLGLIGKYLTGPWMKFFYVSAENQINHIDGILIVKKIIKRLQQTSQLEDPLDMLTSGNDFFGKQLPKNDSTLCKLHQFAELVADANKDQLRSMVKAILSSTVDVLNRQYARYFSMDITQKLREETQSARSHNIDAEEIMGMFSAAQKRTPNATLCFLSCRMRAIKNRTVHYLDSLGAERRDHILEKAVTYGRKQRDQRRKGQTELQDELIKRQVEKKQKRDSARRRELERKLKKNGLESVVTDFLVTESDRVSLESILNGRAVGKNIVHVWSDEGGLTTYNGRMEKLKANKMYKVGYWGVVESYDDAVDYDMSMYSLAVDLLFGDLVLSA